MATQPDTAGDTSSDDSDVYSYQAENNQGAVDSIVNFGSFAIGTLTFDILCTRLAGTLRRYVVYSVRIRHNKELETEETVVDRRYSDFERLHDRLTLLHPGVMSELVFPRKLWIGNFSSENIARRCQMFEQYLSHLCDLPAVCCSLPFCEFFYVAELRRHLTALVTVAPDCDGSPSDVAARGLRTCLLVQLKVRCFKGSEHGALCAAGLVVSHLDAGDVPQAYGYALQLIAMLSVADQTDKGMLKELFEPLTDVASALSLELDCDSNSRVAAYASAAAASTAPRQPSAGLEILHQTLRNALRMALPRLDSA